MTIIDPKAASLLDKENYSPQKTIQDVKMIELKRFTGEDGSFNEAVRIDNGKVVLPSELYGFEVKQINHSRVVPNTVKAWHLHQNQDEIWFIHPEAKLIVGLLDVRENSPTNGLSMKFALGDGRAHLLYIPRGVAHGLSNPYYQDATMTYLVNNWFDGADELRLPYYYIVDREFWDLSRG
jgi:dTDP-4-dehydrorhamnose 3,5-epimerase